MQASWDRLCWPRQIGLLGTVTHLPVGRHLRQSWDRHRGRRYDSIKLYQVGATDCTIRETTNRTNKVLEVVLLDVAGPFILFRVRHVN
jgi:hypothetical protein